jgi:hypothetical protein
MDDRQPSFGLPSGITRNLANTTTPKPTKKEPRLRRGDHTRLQANQSPTNSSNHRVDRPHSFMDDTEEVTGSIPVSPTR